MEQNFDVEKAGALALLDRGIAFRIPAPWLMVLMGKKTIKIKVKRLYLGTLINLSTLEQIAIPQPVKVEESHKKIIADMGTVPVSIPISDIIKHRKQVCEAIAACLLNSRIKIKLFSKALGRYLRRSCTPDQIQELAMWLFVYARPEAFMNTTEYLRKMTVMSPRMTGQEERS